MGATKSRSERLSEEDIDLTYAIDLPFGSRTAQIHLLSDTDKVEIIIANIPTPKRYHMNHSAKTDSIEKQQQHAVAEWVVEDAAESLDGYDWKASSHKADSGNRYLKDVYFTCQSNEVDNAVMDAKKFLTELEANVVKHARHFDFDLPDPPSELLEPED